ncbi:MAG: site-specific integrase [Alphaproteobacteria bacterium]|nr:MAG: site-specific integrase [Alphaproteobacteria bacterium]
MRQTPANRSIPLWHWPTVDRERWLGAIQPSSIFDLKEGDLSQLAPITIEGIAHGYGQWLNWLHQEEPSLLLLRPADRATIERLRAYHSAMIGRGLADYTMASRIRSIAGALGAIEPGHDWSIIQLAADRVHREAKPKKAIGKILQPAADVLDFGFSLMESAIPGMNDLDAGGYGSLRFRDGLLIAFLILCPLRRRNLASLALGKGLEKQGGHWQIRIPGEETKSGREIYCRWPSLLDEALDEYLAVHRPALLARYPVRGPATEALWISRLGGKMTSHAIYETVCRRTEVEFGTAIYPHAFRHIAATTIATLAPEQTDLIMTILGHVSMRSSYKYYNKARTLGAAERMNGTRAKVRRALQNTWWPEQNLRSSG